LSFDSRELGLRLRAAEALAREVGEIARRRFLDRASFTVGMKGPQDFLTEVDGEVERLVATRLHQLFPDDGFIGEEGAGRTPQEGAPTWVVDPIDGTANFSRGVPHWCVSIALVRGAEMLAGAIFDPMLNELFSGALGGGAFLNGAPMRVSATPDMGRASVEVGWNMRTRPEIFLNVVGRVVAQGSGMQRCGSGALALAYVAAGRSDAFIEYHINAWDCLAGNLLVAEAGGYVTDFLARDGLHKGNALLACAPSLRDPLLEIARAEGFAL
jgi:myo-inositol-1(or 4)-monophosphatase